MDYVNNKIHSIRNLRSWTVFISQFPESAIEHKRRNTSQFLNVLEQLWGMENVLCHLLSDPTLSEAHRPLLLELDGVIEKAIALVKEVYLWSEISPEYHCVEHCLEVFTELRWWTYVVVCVVDDRLIRTALYSFATPKGVLEPASSRLPRFVQKLYLWWSGSDGYLRHLPSYGIEVFLQKTSNLIEWLEAKDCGRLLNEFDVNGTEYVIEGPVPALGAHKPPPRVIDRIVDLMKAVLGVSHSALGAHKPPPRVKDRKVDLTKGVLGVSHSALGAHKPPPRVKDRKVDLMRAVLGVSHSALGAHKPPPRVKDRKVDLTKGVLGVSHSALGAHKPPPRVKDRKVDLTKAVRGVRHSALGAHKPPPRVKDRKVDLTKAVLGVSHSALVVKCEDSGTEYALKRVNCSEQKQPILARLAHPHVVQLLDFWRENGFLFLAMELMEGDLAELISRRLKKSKMPFTIDVAVDLMLQIAKTMLYLHDLGLTHPHLKSSDVLFREANGHAKLGKNEAPRYLLKLSDFRFRPRNDFKSLARQNVYQFGLICVEILSMKPLQWRFEERIQGMSEEPKLCFDAVRDAPQSLVVELLTKCIEKCLDGNTQFSEVVVMLLLAQLEVVLTKTTKESSTQCSDGEQLLQQDVQSGLKSSRSSGISRAKCKYDVFIIHRGLDAMLNFIAHQIQKALTERQYTPFVVGRTNIEVEAAIKDTSVHVAIISPRYAESTNCLDELVLMLECRKKNPSAVTLVPIFYEVKPQDLRRPDENGSPFCAAFRAKVDRYPAERVLGWKKALHDAANVKGRGRIVYS